VADVRAVVTGAVGKAKAGKKDDAATADQVLSDLAAAGVEVVAELPGAAHEGAVLVTRALRVRPGTTAAQCRQMAAEWLATARLLEAEPALDPADVDALAASLRDSDDGDMATDYQGLAARLLRSGKVTVKR
jgi:hypothetical protein